MSAVSIAVLAYVGSFVLIAYVNVLVSVLGVAKLALDSKAPDLPSGEEITFALVHAISVGLFWPLYLGRGAAHVARNRFAARLG